MNLVKLLRIVLYICFIQSWRFFSCVCLIVELISPGRCGYSIPGYFFFKNVLTLSRKVLTFAVRLLLFIMNSKFMPYPLDGHFFLPTGQDTPATVQPCEAIADGIHGMVVVINRNACLFIIPYIHPSFPLDIMAIWVNYQRPVLHIQ